MHAFLRRSQKKLFKRTKEETAEKAPPSLPPPCEKRTLRSAATECGSSQNTPRQEIPHSQTRFKEP